MYLIINISLISHNKIFLVLCVVHYISCWTIIKRNGLYLQVQDKKKIKNQDDERGRRKGEKSITATRAKLSNRRSKKKLLQSGRNNSHELVNWVRSRGTTTGGDSERVNHVPIRPLTLLASVLNADITSMHAE